MAWESVLADGANDNAMFLPMYHFHFIPPKTACCVAVALFAMVGCQPLPPLQPANPSGLFGEPPAVGSQPVHVPVANHDLAWEKIVDIVNNYFRVERERRVQLVGQVLTEGRIDTFPQTGATVVEPHRPDSVGRYNRWESTFQTIRRRAVVRVIPDAAGYLVDVEVHKELEDLPRPEHATAGAATFRHDDSLPSRLQEDVSRTEFARQWIPLGRDRALEQQMLAEIQACFLGQPFPGLPFPGQPSPGVATPGLYQ